MEVARKDIEENFLELFLDAVKIRTYSDVPFGVFLSGGIDSSAVTAFMSKTYPSPIKTFTVGFTQEIDERPYARMVADRYQTEHTELIISDRIEDIVKQVITYFDEPFGDSSAIPTYLISREARKHVKMILTGDGGDELFAGYHSYVDQKYQLGNRVSTKAYKTINQLSLKSCGKGILEGLYPRTANFGRAFKHWHWVRSIFHEEELKTTLNQSFAGVADFFKSSTGLVCMVKMRSQSLMLLT